LNGSINGNIDVVITALSPAVGGSPAESTDSIRFNAPLGFVAQNRAVTPDDYRGIIQNSYGNVDTLTVWGGEDSIPPDYGKVYISIKPLDGLVLTDAQKAEVINVVLKPKNVVSITPVLVDPDYTYIDLDIHFKYNPNVSNATGAALAEQIRVVISKYNEDNLKSFGGVFRNSNLLRDIDETSIAIVSNITRITMHKEFVPILGEDRLYEFSFNQALAAKPDGNFITSSEFIYNNEICTLQDYYNDDQAKNVIRILNLSGKSLDHDVGYVAPLTGDVVLEGFNLDSVVGLGDILHINTKPASSDIKPTRNELLRINSSQVTIQGEIDSMVVGGTVAGIGYTTVSN